MTHITFKGDDITTNGHLPNVGTQAPDFTLVDTDLKNKKLSDYLGSCVILNIFPSIDTEICATSVQTFSREVQQLNNTKLLCISRDLPFALARFLEDNQIDNVIGLSDFRNEGFADYYGVLIQSGPLKGLLSRCVVVVDENGTVIHTEQVPEITTQPKYSKVLDVLTAKK